jgi:hypothetical protein
MKGKCVASTTIERGSYKIYVFAPGELGDFKGEPVFFIIGDAVAAQSGVWEQGGATKLDLRFGN